MPDYGDPVFGPSFSDPSELAALKLGQLSLVSLPNAFDVCDGEMIQHLYRVPDCGRLIREHGYNRHELEILTLRGEVDAELTEAAQREFYGQDQNAATMHRLARWLLERAPL